MTCHDVQTRLVETRETPDQTVQQHLENCPDCRRFAAFQAQLLDLPPTVPPAALDQAVLDASAFRLARHRIRRRQGWLLAVAASLLLAAALAALSVFRMEPPAHAAGPGEPSIWDDGEIELALRTIEEGAWLLEQTGNNGYSSPIPSFQELDTLLLDFELKLRFEQAVLGTIEDRLEG